MAELGVADPRLKELQEELARIRARVAERHPQGELAGTTIPLVDLTPLLHARDAAEAKVAAIGRVNPRPAGMVNGLAQWFKRKVARGLNWFVRDQVDFNRGVMNMVQAALDSLNEYNRLAVELNRRIDAARRETAELPPRIEACEASARDLADVHSHWIVWRREWENKLATNEVQFLRATGDLEAAYQQRMLQQEASFRQQVEAQHKAFEAALERYSLDIQKRLWADLERIRLDHEGVIHGELRTARQKAFAAAALPPAAAPAPESEYDQLHFGYKFRGPEEYVKQAFAGHVPFFAGCEAVLDIGCGRGEFLELAREAGIGAHGIDLSAEAVALCRAKELAAIQADAFVYLGGLADGSLDGVFCSQVIEHLQPKQVNDLVRLCAKKLRRGGKVLFETPNPACAAIFTTHFYLDPTHTRPVPDALLQFYCEEAGLGGIEKDFEGKAPGEALDYALRAVKL